MLTLLAPFLKEVTVLGAKAAAQQNIVTMATAANAGPPRLTTPLPVTAAQFNKAMFQRTATAKVPEIPLNPSGSTGLYTPDLPGGTLGLPGKLALGTVRSILPNLPKAPFKPTPIMKPVLRTLTFKKASAILKGITSRISPGGAPPPNSSERSTHWTVTKWKSYLNNIPPSQRSISGRQAAMSPRIDQSAPTLVAASLTNPTNAGATQSLGLQTENTAPSPGGGGMFALAGAAALLLLL